MKAKEVYAILLLLSFLLTSCGMRDSIETDPYEGRALSIGVIGDPLKVRESGVSMKKIDFSDLNNTDLSSKYDAVFVMENNLSKAADAEYASIYKSSDIPFFFIQSTKSYVPFIEEDLSYEDAPDFDGLAYAMGVLYTKDITWSFGLYNDKKNEKNIEDIYSRIFKTISEITVSE